jgi:hypothetical protein
MLKKCRGSYQFAQHYDVTLSLMLKNVLKYEDDHM